MQLSGLLMVPAIFNWWRHSDLCFIITWLSPCMSVSFKVGRIGCGPTRIQCDLILP